MPFGPGTFMGFELDAGAQVAVAPPPWVAGRRLEVYGDSITCCLGCTGIMRYDPT